MIYRYLVTLKNERSKFLNTISRLLALISAIFFLVQQIRSGTQSFIFIISFVLIIAGLSWNWYTSAKKHKPVYYSRILLIAGLTWFAMPFLVWIGFPLLILALLEKQAKFPLEIGFNDDRIVFNSLIKRNFQWSDFSNIMLKDGLLTLDFKNNRLFQRETIDEDDDADEDEFNEYCRKQLSSQATPNELSQATSSGQT